MDHLTSFRACIMQAALFLPSIEHQVVAHLFTLGNRLRRIHNSLYTVAFQIEKLFSGLSSEC